MFASFLKNPALKPSRIYLLVSALCALFSQVYLRFSHGVTSPWMQFLFAIPLLTGFLPSLAFYLCSCSLSAPSRLFYRCAVATLTVGSALRGILEIYGTTSAYLKVYPILSSLLLVLSGLCLTRRAR